MGYRSDVRIITTKKGYNELKKYVDTYLKDRNVDYNLLNSCDVFKYDNEECYFGWDSIKWYDHSEGFEDVDAIESGLDFLANNDYPFRFSRIGESYEDYDERCFDDDWELNDIPFCRYFDDDMMDYSCKNEAMISSQELEVAA